MLPRCCVVLTTHVEKLNSKSNKLNSPGFGCCRIYGCSIWTHQIKKLNKKIENVPKSYPWNCHKEVKTVNRFCDSRWLNLFYCFVILIFNEIPCYCSFIIVSCLFGFSFRILSFAICEQMHARFARNKALDYRYVFLERFLVGIKGTKLSVSFPNITHWDDAV